MAKIAIIDDAICNSFLEKPITARYKLIDGAFCMIEDEDNVEDNLYLTHGTLVAKILQQYATEYEIISVQILDNWFLQHKCSTELLLIALDFCIRSDIDLIHCSIGTERLSHIREMDDLLSQIIQSNIPIVAACSNAKYRTIPASCANVFGVMCDEENILPEGTFALLKNPYLNIEFVANYQLPIIGGRGGAKSNSLAAPVITAKINDLLNMKMEHSIPIIFDELKRKAWPDIRYDSLPNSRIGNQDSVPIVYLVDVFPEDSCWQSKLLNIFAFHGYEAVGLSSATEVYDVRLLCYMDVNIQKPKDIQERIIASTRLDLLLVFLNMETAHIWGLNKEPDALILQITRDDLQDKNSADIVYNKVIDLFN